tara:strand:+ start:1904 stop:2131 length:228 start_codon:yes stop_codon:yes gene_type:complete
MDSISNELYLSLKMKYQNEIQTYKTTLLIYFEKPVGISDHSDHIDEMDQLLEKMACANDKLTTLDKNFKAMYSRL